jgi:osmotically-inducible protein OsmY
VKDGVVTPWSEKSEAERVAWSTPGITQVENYITVTP